MNIKTFFFLVAVASSLVVREIVSLYVEVSQLKERIESYPAKGKYTVKTSEVFESLYDSKDAVLKIIKEAQIEEEKFNEIQLQVSEEYSNTCNKLKIKYDARREELIK